MPAIPASRSIAFFACRPQVPASRTGHGYVPAAELKTIQEIVAWAVLAGFPVPSLREPLAWNRLAGFGFIAAGAFIGFPKR